MFNVIYAKSISKDLKKIAKSSLLQIKESIEELENFPNLSNIKYLTNHTLANYRLRVGNYRILFDVNWREEKIYILKIGHRRNVY